MSSNCITLRLYNTEMFSLDLPPQSHTSIMAAQYDRGVLIGADSRTTSGTYVANRVSDKLTQISDRIFCCRSGSAADTQAIADFVKYGLEMHSTELGRPPLVHTAAHLFRSTCYEYRDHFSAGIICAGWDEQYGGQVYSIPLGGMCVRQPLTIGGSGSTYIYGFCDSNYREDFTRGECIEFVQRALALAMGRDGSSGGVIRLVSIEEGGIERFLFTSEDCALLQSF